MMKFVDIEKYIYDKGYELEIKYFLYKKICFLCYCCVCKEGYVDCLS